MQQAAKELRQFRTGYKNIVRGHKKVSAIGLPHGSPITDGRAETTPHNSNLSNGLPQAASTPHCQNSMAPAGDGLRAAKKGFPDGPTSAMKLVRN